MAVKTAKRRAAKPKEDGVKIRGAFRIKIMEDGKCVGDSGWKRNTIVNSGFQQFLQFAIIASSGSRTASHAALGTGTAPATNATTLPGELTEATSRCALTTGTTGSKTVNFTFT